MEKTPHRCCGKLNIFHFNTFFLYHVEAEQKACLPSNLTFYVTLSRAIHDVKATDMGLSKVRFKAEVDFDGRVVTQSYLEKQDIDQILNVSFLNFALSTFFL